MERGCDYAGWLGQENREVHDSWNESRVSNTAACGASARGASRSDQRAELSPRACSNPQRVRGTVERGSPSAAKTVIAACGGIAPETLHPAGVGRDEP